MLLEVSTPGARRGLSSWTMCQTCWPRATSWCVTVAESHQQYIGVHFEQEDGSILYWVWTVLVLGLRDAAHVFTRAVAPIIIQLRKEGKKILVYIDNVLLFAATKKLALAQERMLYQLFRTCGWVFKPEKRSGEPAQV